MLRIVLLVSFIYIFLVIYGFQAYSKLFRSVLSHWVYFVLFIGVLIYMLLAVNTYEPETGIKVEKEGRGTLRDAEGTRRSQGAGDGHAKERRRPVSQFNPRRTS